MSNREKILSITAKDFDWTPIRSGGPGGQHRNKVETGIRVSHKPSGAKAEAVEERSQLMNRREAFRRITSDPRFMSWLTIRISEVNGMPTPEEVVEKMMADENLRVEVKDERGRWTEASPEAL